MVTGTATVRERLLAERKRDTPGMPTMRPIVNGEKLKEAASYLKSARLAMLNWTKELYAGTENIDLQVDHLQDVLKFCDAVETLRGRLEIKASVFGV